MAGQKKSSFISCLSGAQIAGRTIGRGTRVLVDSGSVSRDPDFWPGPAGADLHAFRPERWAEYRPPRGAGPLPFGFGSRVCPGQHIALAEMRALVAAVLLGRRVVPRAAGAGMDFDMGLGFGLTRASGNVDLVPLA